MYKLKITLILLIVNNLITLASTTSPAEESNFADSTKIQKVFTAVEQMPQFPGGEKAIMDFLSRNINYPQRAMENGAQGRVVVQFVVTKNGTIGEVKVIRSIDPDLDKEAIRVCKLLPKFIPGKMNGQAINTWYTLPITFKLQVLNKENNLIFNGYGSSPNNTLKETFETKAEESNLADSTKLQKEKVFTAVEQIPQFPGGEKALMDFLSRNINYPQRAMENGIQGKVVVQFVVTKNGTVGEVKVLNKVHPDLDNEAIRLCKSLPKFIPGKMNGQPVNVWYTMPITFKLQGLDNSSDNTSQIQETNNLIVKAFGNKTNNPVSINSLAIVEDDIVTAVDVFPEFPGGNTELMKFLSHNINYPQEAMENGIQGKVVVQFIVKKDGTIGTVKVVKSVHPLLDEEAKRLVKMLPKFEPAYRDEKPVNTWYTLPVTFKLQGLAKEPKKPKLFTVFTNVDKEPEGIDGNKALEEFIMKELIYPDEAIEKGIQGEVSLNFTITKSGSVKDIRIIRYVHQLLDKEAIRLVKKMKFKPGIKEGKPIDTKCSISLRFHLPSGQPVKSSMTTTILSF